MVKTERAPMVAALLAVFWAFGAPAAAEASLPLDAPASRVFKNADPFAAAPEMDLPSLTQQLRAMEERRIAASACVALCELAAGIEAHPFGVAAAEVRNRSEDAWGNYRFTSELETSHNRFGFTGHYWDKEASLYYAKARYYDPFTARFTQADSFLGKIDDPPSLHRYQYANANPTFFTDPTGHLSEAQMRELYAANRGLRAFARASDEVAQPITQRLQGVLDFFLPGGLDYFAGKKSETTTTRTAQRQLLDVATSSREGALSRAGAGFTALISQPVSMLNDAASALGSIPGALGNARDSFGAALRADNPTEFAYQMASGIQSGAGALEAGVGVAVGTRGAVGAVTVVEARMASARATIADATSSLPGSGLLNSEFYLKPTQGMGGEVVPGASLLGKLGLQELRRPYVRRPVRGAVDEVAPRTEDGRPIDPNTFQPIESKPDLGHKYGREFRREKAQAEAEGLTQKEFNERMNNPDLYQLEDRASNRSHKYEKPGKN